MSRICKICGKGSITGHNVSHSKRRTKRTWKPNLVKTKIGNGRRISICTRCRKGLLLSQKKSTHLNPKEKLKS